MRRGTTPVIALDVAGIDLTGWDVRGKLNTGEILTLMKVGTDYQLIRANGTVAVSLNVADALD